MKIGAGCSGEHGETQAGSREGVRVKVCKWRQVIQSLRTSYLGEAGTFPWPVLIPATRYKRALSPPFDMFLFSTNNNHRFSVQLFSD